MAHGRARDERKERQSTVAKDDKRGTPQGAPISPLLSNLYLRRFLLGWKTLGLERKLRAQIVSYADDFVILLRRGHGVKALEALRSICGRLSLKLSEEKYRLLLEQIPDVVWRADSSGNPIFMTANVEKMLGYTPQEIYDMLERCGKSSGE